MCVGGAKNILFSLDLLSILIVLLFALHHLK